MIDFPSAPTVGQTYTYGARTWVWNGDGWERQINAGQSVSIFVVGVLVVDLAAFPTIDNSWQVVDYV